MPKTVLEKRDAHLRKTYGITLDQWQQMYVMSQGTCWICGRKPKTKPLETDHDHLTGRVRGLLCFRCNHRLLGRGLDLPYLHLRAAQYLRGQFDAREIGTDADITVLTQGTEKWIRVGLSDG